MGFKDKIHNPCGDDIWGDLTEDKYEKLTKVVCPKGKWCPYTRKIRNKDMPKKHLKTKYKHIRHWCSNAFDFVRRNRWYGRWVY